MRKSLTAGVLSLSLLTGYAAADVFDLVPGVLTRDKPTPPPAATTPAGPVPTLIPLPGEVAGDPLPVAVGTDAKALGQIQVQRSVLVLAPSRVLR